MCLRLIFFILFSTVLNQNEITLTMQLASSIFISSIVCLLATGTTTSSAWSIFFGDRQPTDRIFSVQYERSMTNGLTDNLSVAFDYCGTGIQHIALIKLNIIEVSASMP